MSDHICDTNPIRVRYRKVRAWLRWVNQGRPRTHPVVIEPGEILSCRHGYALIQNWAWDFNYMHMPVDKSGTRLLDVGHLADILGALYGTSRVKELDCCPACQSVVTA